MLLAAGLGMAIWYALGRAARSGIGLVVVETRAGAGAGPGPDRSRGADGQPRPGGGVHPGPGHHRRGEIRVPIAHIVLGPADVPTGFPHTPAGAVGQLAAIEKTVLESMSLPLTGQVHTAWVQPGGPSLEEWELTRNVQSFLAAARQGGWRRT